MAKQKKHPSGTIAQNKKALHDYFIEQRFEAGVALAGWEVKSLRAGKAQLVDSYVLLKDGEAWLLGSHITPLTTASTHVIADPVRTRKLKRSAQAWWLLLRQDGAGRLWLERRPPTGIWAGLYCPPVYDSRAALDEALQLHASCDARDLPAFTHVLTHRDLHLHPVLARDATPQPNAHCAEQQSGWFAPAQWPALGLPAPVRKLLASLGDGCQK